MDQHKKHIEMLYPTVRVLGKDTGGSGTVLYSSTNKDGEVITLVITNHHVIADCITVKEGWDQFVGEEIKKEYLATCSVEFFKYNQVSHCIGSFSVEADIVAYDSVEDMAILQLRDKENVASHVALLYDGGKKDPIYTFDEVFVVGAALGHSPIPTNGVISCMDDEIENYKYWQATASSIYGNSGGAVYRYSAATEQYEYIGMPSRIDVIMLGFSSAPVTHMGYFIPLDRITEFFDRNYYQFIYDETQTIEECAAKREAEREEAKQKFEFEHRTTVRRNGGA